MVWLSNLVGAAFRALLVAIAVGACLFAVEMAIWQIPRVSPVSLSLACAPRYAVGHAFSLFLAVWALGTGWLVLRRIRDQYTEDGGR